MYLNLSLFCMSNYINYPNVWKMIGHVLSEISITSHWVSSIFGVGSGHTEGDWPWQSVPQRKHRNTHVNPCESMWIHQNSSKHTKTESHIKLTQSTESLVSFVVLRCICWADTCSFALATGFLTSPAQLAVLPPKELLREVAKAKQTGSKQSNKNSFSPFLASTRYNFRLYLLQGTVSF